jgi:hypothetical protein
MLYAKVRAGRVSLWMVLVMCALLIHPLHYIFGGDGSMVVERVAGSGLELAPYNIPADKYGAFSEGSSAVAWILGACVFPLYRRISVTRRGKWAFLAAGVAGFCLCVFYIAKLTPDGMPAAKVVYSVYSYMLTAIYFLCFLLFCKGCPHNNNAAPRASLRVARFFSGYMYSLFITHYSVWVLLDAFPPYSELADGLGAAEKLAVEFLIAHAVALAFWFVFERNGKRLGAWIRMRVYPSTATVKVK